jgi:hypothetical protein
MRKLFSGLVLGTSAMISLAAETPIPTAIFHGFGDECNFPGMEGFVEYIANKTGSYAACIEIGSGSVSSIFENFEK